MVNRLLISAFAVITALLVGVLVGYERYLLLALGAGAIATALMSWWVPGLVLGVALPLTLAGGTFQQLSSVAITALVLSAVVALPRLLSAWSQVRWVVSVPSVFLAYLALRFAVEDGFGAAIVPLRAISVVLVVAHVTVLQTSKRPGLRGSFAIAGTIYIVLTVGLGEFNAVGLRFQGISGNPNRMVFGLLIFAPFVIGYWSRRLQRWGILVSVLLGFVSAGLIVVSGSSQSVAVAGLVLLFMLFRMTLAAGPAVRFLLFSAGALAAAWGLPQLGSRVVNDPDLATLSGRTPAYRAAVRDFLSDPIFGTGELHVSGDLIQSMSAHSALLGILASGGVLSGLYWICLVAYLLVRCLRKSGIDTWLRFSVIALLGVQLVQSVEYQFLTWALIAYVLCGVRRVEREGHPAPLALPTRGPRLGH